MNARRIKFDIFILNLMLRLWQVSYMVADCIWSLFAYKKTEIYVA